MGTITEGDGDVLDPALWSRLPQDLVDVIVRNIFESLGVADVVRLRVLSRAWNSIILASRPRTQNNVSKGVFSMCEKEIILLYDSKRSVWHHKPLTFFKSRDHMQIHGQHDSLQFITTDGGILCFSTSTFGQFLVCNLITERWKDLHMPPNPGFCQELNLNPGQAMAETPSIDSRPCNLLVGLIVERPEGDYKLVVASMYAGSDGTRKTMIYSSISKSWKEVAGRIPSPTPTDTCRLPFGSDPSRFINGCLTYDGNVYCLVKYQQILGLAWELLKLDVKKECWSIVPLPKQKSRQCWQITLQLLQHRGRLVLMESISWQVYEFYMLQEGSDQLCSVVPWIKLLQDLTRLMGSLIRSFSWRRGSTCLRCLGYGDFIYFVEENFGNTPKPLKVLSCNLSRGTSDFWESTETGFLNQSRCCVFEPSLAPVH